MAQQIVITDDLDGTSGAQTVTFALMGKPWEIDLSDANIKKLEKALQPFIEKARPAGASVGAQRQRRTPAASEKVDYTDPRHFGQLHRGRVTEEEASLVRADIHQANLNRKAAGQPEIDPNDPAEKKRYGFK